jgi:hypothetical protein
VVLLTLYPPSCGQQSSIAQPPLFQIRDALRPHWRINPQVRLMVVPES